MLQSLHLLDALHGAQLLDECFEAGVVVNHDGEVAAEQAVVRVDVDRAQDEFLVLRYDAGEVVDNADVVVADDTQGDGILAGALAAPLGTYDTIAEALLQLWGVGTVLTVYLDAAIDGDKAKHLVAIDGLTAAASW